MEVNNLDKKPLPLEREDKLKFFAILAIRKDLQPEIKKKAFMLSIAAAYTGAEAIVSSRQEMEKMGVSPDGFLLPALMMGVDVEKIVKLPERKEELQLPAIIQEKKSTQDMVSYVRFIFDTVGSELQKNTAEIVIKKFEEKNKGGNEE